MQMLSPAQSLALLPEAERVDHLEGLAPEVRAHLNWHWSFWARPNQIAPEGEWATWLILAGRGFGKTRSGAEWVRSKVDQGYRRIAIVAETAADARDVLVEGKSGILNISPDAERPLYEPSKRRLTWPNGAVATLYNGTEPDQLRGPEHDAALVDELAKYKDPQGLWDMLQFGLRLGQLPQVCVATTPRPIPLLRQLIQDETTIVTRGSTYDNAANLSPSFIERIKARYEGTRLGRQEIAAELLDDVPGALWTASLFKRVKDLGEFQRIVVGVDPSGASGEDDDGADEIGIVVAGKRHDGTYAIIEDASCKLSPSGWGRRSVERYRDHLADAIIAERNFGGAMVEAVIRTANQNAKVKLVTASRGKAVRAEPVAALYEQGRVDHAAGLEELEDQMMHMTSSGYVGDGSPDRLDAAVWAVTELMEGSNYSWSGAI